MSEKLPHSPEHSQQGILEAIRTASTVTLEFGTADTPLYKETKQHFSQDNLYIGVNIDTIQHEHLQSEVTSVAGYAVLGVRDEKGMLKQLPLPDSCVDRIYMGNVFGEPDEPYIMDHFKDEDGIYHGHSSDEAKIQTIFEAHRLLEPDGELVIVETNTPYRGGAFSKPAFEVLKKLLIASGYEVTETVSIKDPEWAEVAGQYINPDTPWYSYRSYIVIAKKTALVQ